MNRSSADAVRLRREFHSYPEVAFCELRTSARIAEELATMGLEPRVVGTGDGRRSVSNYPSPDLLDAAAKAAIETGADPEWVRAFRDVGSGVIVDIVGDRPGPSWAFRFDIDALAINESTEAGHKPFAEGFGSNWSGRMHACAHDGHAAIGLVLASRLQHDRSFAGAARFIFQPAEEGGRGASLMLSLGALEGVDRLVALHLGLDRDLKEVVGGVRGAFATDKLRVNFSGISSHAGLSPEKGRNALAAAATASLAMLGLPRWGECATRVNVGTMSSGDGVNVIPSTATLTAEVRAAMDHVQSEMLVAVKRIIRGAADMYGCGVEIERTGGSTTIRSDSHLAMQFCELAEELGGVGTNHEGFNASDDASLLMSEVQTRGGSATYVIVGAGNRAPHHSSSFDVEEEAIGFSIDLLEKAVRKDGEEV